MRIQRNILCFFLLLTAVNGLAADATNQITISSSNQVTLFVPAGPAGKKPSTPPLAAATPKSLHRYLILLAGAGIGGLLLGGSFYLQQKFPPPRPVPANSKPAQPGEKNSSRYAKSKAAARAKG